MAVTPSDGYIPRYIDDNTGRVLEYMGEPVKTIEVEDCQYCPHHSCYFADGGLDCSCRLSIRVNAQTKGIPENCPLLKYPTASNILLKQTISYYQRIADDLDKRLASHLRVPTPLGYRSSSWDDHTSQKILADSTLAFLKELLETFPDFEVER